MSQPTGEEVGYAREDLQNDAKFWHESSDVVRGALSATMQLGLSGFDFGKFVIDRGMLDAYHEILTYVEERLAEGVVATEALADALDGALTAYDRADEGAASKIGNAPHGR